MPRPELSSAYPFFRSDQPFSLTDLDNLASYRIVRRGLDYARAGRILDLAAAPKLLEARVAGTGSEPYHVELFHDGQGLVSSCTCPFEWEPICKHGIAALAGFFELVDQAPQRPEAMSPLENEEVAVRRQRAGAGDYRVMKMEGGRFLGRYLVQSPADDAYDVEIRSLRDTVNRCTCPDHATSMLGTCKHIEAVLLSLRKRAARKYEKAAGEPSEIGQVLADYTDTPRIRMLMPGNATPALKDLARRYFDSEGFFRRDPADDFTDFLGQARRLRKLVVYEDAVELADSLRAERRARARREEVHRDVLHGGSRPGGAKSDLYPYQQAGTAFLASTGRALLGDEMGLGKTIQAIAASRILAERGEVNRTLIICPASLKAQWSREIQHFFGIESQIISGSPATRRAQYREGLPFTIMNYELALRDREGIADLAPELLILDEAQRIRNWRTKTAAAIKEIEATFAFVLTGTALQNRLDDLYSIMQVVDRRVLGPLWAYNEKFVVRGDAGSKILGYRNLDELRRRLAPQDPRRTLSEVKLQLPERIDSRFGVELTAMQRNLMDESVAVAARYARIAQKRPLSPEELKRMMSAMQNARMACNAAGLVDKETEGSPKLDEFEQLIDDLCLGENRKVVVFSEWVKFCGLAAERADGLGIGYVRFDGSVPTPRRGALIDRFRDDPDCKIFFATDAGGVGLNLQFASAVINLEMPWNPAVLDQRIGRLHRHGQTDPVHVFLMVAEDSFENSLERTLSAKRDLFAAVLDQQSAESTVDAPSSCLHVVRDALEDLGILDIDIEAEELEPDLEPDLGPAAVSDSRPDPEHRAQSLADILGARLHQVMVLASGRVVALVDRVDEAATSAAQSLGMSIAESSLVEAMAALGGDSPFTGGRPLLDRSVSADEEGRKQRDRWLRVARRRLDAARVLTGSDLGAEALGQASESMLAAACAAAGAIAIDDRKPSSQLLFEVLVPQGVLDLEQAATIARAEGLARSYADATQPVPGATMKMVLGDAEKLLAWADC